MRRIKRLKLLNTLRTRLVLWSLLVNALLLVAFGSGVWLTLREVQNRQIDDTLELSAAQLASSVDVSNGQLIVPPDDLTTLAGQGVFIWVINSAGHVDLATGQATNLAMPEVTDTIQDATLSGTPVRLYRRILSENNGVALLGISLNPLRQTLQTVLIILGATIPLALIVSTLGSIFLANRALHPISAITTQAKRISRENLSERLGFTTRDEVGQLAQTFDGMLDRLQSAFEQERQFVGNASHELRTPLGMLKAQISLATSRPRDAASLNEMLKALDGDVDRLTRLVETMLNLMRVETTPLAFTSVNLTDLLDGLVDQLQPLANERQIVFTLQSSGAAWVTGDSDQLVQLFLNLLDNAIKYSNINGSVRVALVEGDREWQVRVSDTGIGIAAENLPHVFERFYRADLSRTRQTGGIGLGLTIAEAIARQHNGRIMVQSTLGVGSTFTVALPKAKGP